ncbi:MAG: hypothetical protein PVI54_20015 [Desulfobacteraceae bacterium]
MRITWRQDHGRSPETGGRNIQNLSFSQEESLAAVSHAAARTMEKIKDMVGTMGRIRVLFPLI